MKTWQGNVSKLQLFIVMWYVRLVFTFCATFFAATKTRGKFSITKGNLTGLQRETQPSFMNNDSLLFIPLSKRQKVNNG